MSQATRGLGGAVLLVAVAGGLFFQGLGRYPLLDPDEARHAEVAREMAAGSGARRLFLPTLDLEPYREKSAGYYWLVAFSYRAFGVGEVAARAGSALAALGAVLALYAHALQRWSSARGRASETSDSGAVRSSSGRSGRCSGCQWASSTGATSPPSRPRTCGVWARRARTPRRSTTTSSGCPPCCSRGRSSRRACSDAPRETRAGERFCCGRCSCLRR